MNDFPRGAGGYQPGGNGGNGGFPGDGRFNRPPSGPPQGGPGGFGPGGRPPNAPDGHGQRDPREFGRGEQGFGPGSRPPAERGNYGPGESDGFRPGPPGNYPPAQGQSHSRRGEVGDGTFDGFAQGGSSVAAPPRPAPPQPSPEPRRPAPSAPEPTPSRGRHAQTSADRAATNAAAAELRSDDLWLLRNLPLHLVIPLALIGVAISLIVVAAHAPWWAALAAGVVPVLLGLVPIGGVPLGLRLGRWLAYRWQQARRQSFDESGVVDVPMPDGGSCGLRWDGTLITTMLRIDSPPDTLTLLRRGSLSTDQLLPLDEIAACLRQYDVELHSVDVISNGTRTASTEAVISGYAASIAPLGRLYDEILGPLPAIAHRTMWLVLRLNPLDNAKAVDNRGGGPEGALRSALVATRRVANRLAGHGITASVLTTPEMTSALREIARGIPLSELTENPDNLEYNGTHLTSYQIDPQLFNSDGLAKIWAVRSLATTVAVRLQPVAEPNARPGQPAAFIEVDARVRYDTPYEHGEPPVAGLKELPRRQLWALMDLLFYGAQEIRPSGYRGPVDVLTNITMPTAGCGQLIGADATGSGIAVPLIGDGSRRIDIIASLPLAQQVILRAIALGAGAVVHTARPWAWQGMVANVAAPHALALASSVTHSARGTAVTGRLPTPAATVIVFDGVPASAPPGSATVVTIHESQPADYEPDADVTIVQHPDAPHTITVRTPATTTTAQMVTTPAEQHYLSGALARR
ncbi:type VII secretion protein EccE [Nocardia sp. NPDC059240]|uniref:type VII secretion protein EccE n=1 Tax=Nocardia sp. NPDC059240 TaxID=3346786 RepID=UPI003676611F